MWFKFWSMSEDSRVEILLRGSSVRVCLVVLNQGCCGSGQYNLPDGCWDLMLIQPWIKVMYCSLLWLTFRIRVGISISYLSIPGIVAHDRCYISHCFVLCVYVFNCLSCSACILQMHNKPNQFPIQIKVYFFIIIYSFIYFIFFFWLSNFSHMKRLRLADYFVCLFCFLSWNCRIIIHNFITFHPFPKDLQCSSFISILT